MTNNLEQIFNAKMAKQEQALSMIKRWSERVEKIKSREEAPLSEAAFCNKYDIHIGRFNQIKNGKATSLPSLKIIDKVENALKSEGV